MSILESIAKTCEEIDAARNVEFAAAAEIQTTEEKILEGESGDPAPAESTESEVE